ncbi:MAG: gamma carbonic anhydrase family protein [Burkholderiales bacterium]|nr:gamma carbonic anhydrase family protein [Burkholderiales bacterium]
MDSPGQLISAPFEGVPPVFAGPPRFCGHGAAVLGRAKLGAEAWLGAYSVIRADGHDIRIGDGFHIGVHSTVHIAHAVYPTHVGNRVSVGDYAVVHACEVGDDCIVEDGATVLDGAVVGRGAIIERDAVVFPRARLAPGQRYAGVPAKAIGPVDPTELAARHAGLRSRAVRVDCSDLADAPSITPATGARAFVAPGVHCTGRVALEEAANVWFGCALHGGEHGVRIGAGANVQDNSFLYAISGPLVIEPDATIGHNVILRDCRVMSGALVGISSSIAPGTVVEPESLVAAGSTTTPGQVISSGWLWAGRPARRLRALDEATRAMLREVPPVYRAYAAEFGAAFDGRRERTPARVPTHAY